MKPNKNKTALLIFSLSAKKEAERKPLFGNNKKNVSEHFFKTLNQKTLSIAKKSGIDVIWLDETKQKGNNFSERFFNAFNSLFAQGYNSVISIGNDTPNLTVKHIKEAIDLLPKQQIVIGPSKDGGVYLLGYTKAVFNKTVFKTFSWLTNKVSNEIEEFAISKNIPFTCLEVLIDIDKKSNLFQIAYLNPSSLLSLYILLHLVTFKNSYKSYILNFTPNLTSLVFFLRGPPFIL